MKKINNTSENFKFIFNFIFTLQINPNFQTFRLLRFSLQRFQMIPKKGDKLNGRIDDEIRHKEK